MSSARTWRKEELEKLVRNIAEQVIDERIEATKQRGLPSVYEGLSSKEIKGRMAFGVINA